MARLHIFIFLFVMAGCVNYSTQLNDIQASRAEGVDVDQFLWRAQWQGQEVDLYPINLEDQTVFANREGVIIRFNGWEVFQVIFPELEFDTIFNFLEGELIVSGSYAYRMDCSAWEVQEQGTSLRHNRQCTSDQTSSDNYLIVNDRGETVEIHQLISEDSGYLNLRKL
ncbi:MAG: hypothetical protein ACO2ZB_02770 [Gammaproteobacteria bacterium]|jgi:hypothetical protein